MTTPEAIRSQILALVKDYHEAKFANKSFHLDAVMDNTFFIGVYPGIDDKRLNHIKAVFDRFMAGE